MNKQTNNDLESQIEENKGGWGLGRSTWITWDFIALSLSQKKMCDMSKDEINYMRRKINYMRNNTIRVSNPGENKKQYRRKPGYLFNAIKELYLY